MQSELWWVLQAWAAPVIPASGVPEQGALERAAWAAGGPEGLALEAAPRVGFEGAAAWAPCASPPSDSAAVGYALDRADAALAWDRQDAAAEALALATEAIRCHPSPESVLLGRWHALLGVLAAAREGESSALSHFARARRADPALVWGDGWPAEPDLLRRATLPPGDAARAVLTVVGGPLRLDGVPVEGAETLWPGTYYARIDAGPGLLTLTDGRAVWTGALGDDLADPEARPALSAWAAWRFGAEEPVYVVTPSAVWSVRGDDWVQRERLGPSPLVRGGWFVAAAGAGVALASVAPAFIGQARTERAAAQIATASDATAWEAAIAEHAAGARQVRAGRAGAGVGAGIAVVGLGITFAGVLDSPRSRPPEQP